MIKGDKIRLVKEMGAFKNIGEICEVVDISEGGVISFRFGGVHLGCMSYDEYKKYFEKVEEPVKREWSDWKTGTIRFSDLTNKTRRATIRYRDNGKKIQVKCGSYKSESTCCKEDVFDFNKGFHLAVSRFIVKYLDGQRKALARSM